MPQHPVERFWAWHEQLFPVEAHLPGETVPIGDRRVSDVAGFPLSHGLLAPCGWDHSELPPFPDQHRGVLMLGNHLDAISSYERRAANPPVVYGDPCPPPGRKRMWFWSKLYKLLERARIDRGDVFVTNVHPCFVSEGDARRTIDTKHDGYEEWIGRCHEFLAAQIDLMRPALVVPLGDAPREFFIEHFGASGLAPSPPSLGSVARAWGKIPVVAIRHPSYVQPKSALEREAELVKIAWRNAICGTAQ